MSATFNRRQRSSEKLSTFLNQGKIQALNDFIWDHLDSNNHPLHFLKVFWYATRNKIGFAEWTAAIDCLMGDEIALIAYRMRKGKVELLLDTGVNIFKKKDVTQREIVKSLFVFIARAGWVIESDLHHLIKEGLELNAKDIERR